MSVESLESKRDASLAVLGDALERADNGLIAVAWTGGKDSTVALHLWMELLRQHSGVPPLALTIDTGLKFPEAMAFRQSMAKTWGVEVMEIGPEPRAGAPVSEDRMECCRLLKIEPLRKAIVQIGISVLITGIRRDEHPSRQDRLVFEQRSDPDYLQVSPLLDWTEMDIWSYIAGRGLPYCELYDLGYRSLGCMPCTILSGSSSGERSGRDERKESCLSTLHHLGYF